MKNETIFYIAICFTIIGLALIGFGVGKMFAENCIGILIGLGSGLLTTGIILFKIFRRKDAFDKK
jgi:hypothetical protein